MGCNHNCDECSENCSHNGNKSKSLLERPNKYSSVKKTIAIVSGKGGVGKSMVTALLATSLSKKGYKTGILDADITGPSIPRMFGVFERGEGTKEGLLPSLSNGGVKVMSSHLLLEHDTDPIVWRGALISGLVKQFWTDVIWENVDFLFVDMPPGTGDVPLTVFQSIGVDGIIIVTSPQELVQMIVEKACNMAKMMNIDVIGIVENMSYLECPKCKEHIEVFGKSTVNDIAKKFGLKVLAKIPIDNNLSKLSDSGKIEEYNANYLNDALTVLENLPVKSLNIASPVDEDGRIIEKIENAKCLHIYNVVRGMVIAAKKVLVNEVSEIYPKLKENDIHTILCDKIDPKYCTLLEEEGMEVIIECHGYPLDALQAYLEMDSDDSGCDGDCAHCNANCDHRVEEECNHDCSNCANKDCNERK